MARFKLEMDDTNLSKEKIVNSSNNSSVYKQGETEGSSVKTNYLHISSVQTILHSSYKFLWDFCIVRTNSMGLLHSSYKFLWDFYIVPTSFYGSFT